MNITISEKSPVYGKLVSLGHALALDPSLLAAGMCHAALNAPGSAAILQPALVAAQITPAAPAVIPAAEQPELPLTMPEQPQPKAAPSAGMFDIA